MTPAQYAHKLGVELKTVSEVSGVPLRTLQRWKTTKPFVFAAVCEKCRPFVSINDRIEKAKKQQERER